MDYKEWIWEISIFSRKSDALVMAITVGRERTDAIVRAVGQNFSTTDTGMHKLTKRQLKKLASELSWDLPVYHNSEAYIERVSARN